MPLPQKQVYTSEDYWNLPDGQRAELIDGKLYAMAPPNRIHQKLVSRLTQTIGSFIDSNIEDVEPDEYDLQMLKAIESDPECHEFTPENEIDWEN